MKFFKEPHNSGKKLKFLIVVLAAIVIFTTTYSLVLPAITMETVEAETTPGIVLHEIDAGQEGKTTDSSGPKAAAGGTEGKGSQVAAEDADSKGSKAAAEDAESKEPQSAAEDAERQTPETKAPEKETTVTQPVQSDEETRASETKETTMKPEQESKADSATSPNKSKDNSSGTQSGAKENPTGAQSGKSGAKENPTGAQNGAKETPAKAGSNYSLSAVNTGVTYGISAQKTTETAGNPLTVNINASVGARTGGFSGAARYAYVLVDPNRAECLELSGVAAGSTTSVTTKDGKSLTLHKESDGFWFELDAWNGEDIDFDLNFNTIQSGGEEPDEARMDLYIGGGISAVGLGTALSARGDALRNRALAAYGYAESDTYVSLTWTAEEEDTEPVLPDEFTVSADPIYGYFHTPLPANFHAQAGRGSENNVFYVRQNEDRALAAILKDAQPGDVIEATDAAGNPITDRYGTQLLFHVTEDGFWFELDNSKHNNFADFSLTYQASDDASAVSSNAAKMRLYLAQDKENAKAAETAGTKFSPDLSLTWSDSGDKMHYEIDLAWDTSIEEDKYDQEVVTTSQTKLEPKYILNLHISSVNYDAGQFEMRLPYALWAYRGSTTGKDCAMPTKLSIPKEGEATKGSLFQYRVEYDPAYPGDLSKAHLVITNCDYLPAGTKVAITVKYDVEPWKTVDLSTASLTVLATAQATSQTSPEYGESNTITYKLDTGFNATYLRKESSMTSAQAAPVYQKPAFVSADNWDPDNYNMVRYHIKYGVNGNYNQPMTHEFLATLPEGAELVAVADSASASRGLVIDSETGTWTTTSGKEDSFRYSTDGEYWFYVRYPRTEEATLTYTARVDMETTASDPDSHTPPEDYNDKDHKYLEYEFTWKDYEYIPGKIDAYDKFGGDKNFVEAVPSGNVRFYWRAYQSYNAYDLKKGESQYIRITDDAQFWKYVPKSYSTNNWKNVHEMNWLEEGTDYELDSLSHISIEYTGVNLRDGSVTYPDFPGGDLKIEAYNCTSQQWETVKTITVPAHTNRKGQSITVPYDGKAVCTFAEGSGYSRLRVTSPEFGAGTLKMQINFYTRMKKSETVMKWKEECPDDKQVYIRNYAAFQHYSKKYDENGVLQDYRWDDRNSAANSYALRDGEDQTLAARDVELNQYDGTTGEKEYLLRTYNGAQLTHFGYIARMDKTTEETINDLQNQRAIVPFTAYAFEATSIPLEEQYNEAFQEFSQNSGVFYDLLPPGYKYLQDTVEAQSIKGKDAAIDSIETIDDYKGTGRQMLIVHVKTAEEEPADYSYQNDPNLGAKSGPYTTDWVFGKTVATRIASNYGSDYKRYTGFLISFKTYIPWKKLVDHPVEVNLVSFARTDGQPIRRGDANKGYPDTTINNSVNTTQAAKEFQKVKDKNGNYAFYDFAEAGGDTVKSSLYGFSTANPQVVDGVQTGIYKRVLGDEGKADMGHGGEGWRELDRTKLQGSYSYKITTYSSMGMMKDLIVYDTLEDAKNKEGAENEKTWKGTFASVDVSEAEDLGFAPVIYYSTVKGLDYNTVTGDDDITWIEDDSIWSTTCPEDKSAVTAIAVDLRKMKDGSDAELNSKSGDDDTDIDRVSFIINMTAPEKYPTDSEMIYAINRPAYSCYQKGFFSADGVHKNDIGLRVKIRLPIEVRIRKLSVGGTTPDTAKFTLTCPNGYVYRFTYADFEDGEFVFNDEVLEKARKADPTNKLIPQYVEAGEYKIAEDAKSAEAGGIIPEVIYDEGTNGVIDVREKTAQESLLTITNFYGNGLTLKKVDASDMKTVLPDAQFTLTQLDEAGTGHEKKGGYKEVKTSDAKGLIAFEGLPSGYYALEETKAPAGYVICEDKTLWLHIENGNVTLLKKTEGSKVEDWPSRDVPDTVQLPAQSSDGTLVIGNTPGAALPNTGGAGTRFFAVLGLILVLGSGGLLVRRKRTTE